MSIRARARAVHMSLKGVSSQYLTTDFSRTWSDKPEDHHEFAQNKWRLYDRLTYSLTPSECERVRTVVAALTLDDVLNADSQGRVRVGALRGELYELILASVENGDQMRLLAPSYVWLRSGLRIQIKANATTRQLPLSSAVYLDDHGYSTPLSTCPEADTETDPVFLYYSDLTTFSLRDGSTWRMASVTAPFVKNCKPQTFTSLRLNDTEYPVQVMSNGIALLGSDHGWFEQTPVAPYSYNRQMPAPASVARTLLSDLAQIEDEARRRTVLYRTLGIRHFPMVQWQMSAPVVRWHSDGRNEATTVIPEELMESPVRMRQHSTPGGSLDGDHVELDMQVPDIRVGDVIDGQSAADLPCDSTAVSLSNGMIHTVSDDGQFLPSFGRRRRGEIRNRAERDADKYRVIYVAPRKG